MVCEADQYFPPDIVNLSETECFVDIGAFTGDTVQDFIRRTHGRFESILCFEVDPINYNALTKNVAQMPERDRIHTYNVGIWDKETDITFKISNSQSVIGMGDGKGTSFLLMMFLQMSVLLSLKWILKEQNHMHCVDLGILSGIKNQLLPFAYITI